MEQQWFAVYTRPRFEKKVAERLSAIQVENYCPFNKVLKQWSDRKKIVEEPLFKSYVFLKVNQKQHLEIRKIIGVVNFVNWLGKPAIIKETEILTIKRFLLTYQHVKLEKVKVNDMIRITDGPLMYAEGNIIEIKNKTVKVYLPSLGYEMFAEIEKSNIEIISK